MTFDFDKRNGQVYFDDGDTQYFIKTDAKTHRDAWKETNKMIRERRKPPLRLIYNEGDLK